MPINFGELVLNETIKQGMIQVAEPDPEEAHVFVWDGNSVSQLDALIRSKMEGEIDASFWAGYNQGWNEYQQS